MHRLMCRLITPFVPLLPFFSQRNETADALEKIERPEFIVDRALVAELQAAAAARVASLREEIQRQHLHLELVAQRVKVRRCPMVSTELSVRATAL